MQIELEPRDQGAALVNVQGRLDAAAAPTFKQQITDAISQLSGMRVRMEQYFQDNRSYVGACKNGTVAPLPTSPNFVFTCNPTPTLTGYTVVATGVGGVANFVYTINQANQRTSSFPSGSGWAGSTTCWVIRKDGSC